MISHEIGVLSMVAVAFAIFFWAIFSTANIKRNKPEN